MAAMKKVLHWGLVSAILLLGLFGFYRHTLHQQVEERFRRIRSQDNPITLAELDRWYAPPPADQDATAFYTNALARFRNPPQRDTRRGGTSHGRPKESVGALLSEYPESELQNDLETNREFLLLLHDRPTSSLCRYPTDLTKGRDASLHHLSRIRAGARLLALGAAMHAERFDFDTATELLMEAFALTRTVNREPMYFSYAISRKWLSVTLDAMEFSLNKTAGSAPQLRALEACLREPNVMPDLARALVGERCCWIAVYHNLPAYAESDGGSSLALRAQFNLHRFTGQWNKDLVLFLDLFDELVDVAKQPLPARLPAARRLEAKLGSVPRSLYLTRTLTSLFDPWLSDIKRDTLTRVRLQTALVAIAVEKRRLSSDELPTELPATALTDPFTGQPLRYKRLVKGYVVYSVGEDGADDGGDEKKDVCFTVVR